MVIWAAYGDDRELQRYTTEEKADEPIKLFTHTCMQTYGKHAHSLFSWCFLRSPVLSDLPKLTPHLQFDSSSMCVLNINEMDSISHSWLL